MDVKSLLSGFSSISICAHDAGAAVHLREWLNPIQSNVRLCVEGPAVRVFKKWIDANPACRTDLAWALDGADCLVSGSGWASDLEHVSRLQAQRLGIYNISALDHWVNYGERFQRAGCEVLPDQFWVSDIEAAYIASLVFPGIPVLTLPNTWLDALCKQVAAERLGGGVNNVSMPRKPARRLLYLLEPIRVPWSQGPGGASEAGEIQGLRYWLQQLPHLIQQGWVAPQHELEALALRPHPSEPAGKYDALIAEAASSWPVQLDRAPALAEALAWADAAFGCETQALVAAMACHLPAFSTVPPWAPPCRLPQASLHHLSRLEGA